MYVCNHKGDVTPAHICLLSHAHPGLLKLGAGVLQGVSNARPNLTISSGADPGLRDPGELNGGGSFVVRAFPADRRKIDIGDYYADDRRIRRRLGWRPRVDLRTALDRTLAYYRRELRHYV